MNYKNLLLINIFFAIFLGVSFAYYNYTLVELHYGGYLLHGGLSFLLLSMFTIPLTKLNGNNKVVKVTVIYVVFLILFSLNEIRQIYDPNRIFDLLDILNQAIGLTIAYFLLLMQEE